MSLFALRRYSIALAFIQRLLVRIAKYLLQKLGHGITYIDVLFDVINKSISLSRCVTIYKLQLHVA